MKIGASSRAWSEGLSGPVRGVLWMAAASGFYSLVYISVRHLTDAFAVSQVVFFRAFLGTAFMLPWLARAGLRALRTRRLGLYTLRVGMSYAGALAWMYGIAHMPLADANALMFLMPVFTVIFAALMLRESVGVDQWAATAIGFVGALIIIRPGMIGLSYAALATLLAAACFSLALVWTRSLALTENPNAIVFYLYGLMIPFSVGPAAADWAPIDWSLLPWLIALGLTTVGAQQCSTRAFVAAPASVVVPVHYLQLPLIAALAWLMFGQTVDLWTWVGAAVICASTYYLARRQARRRRPAPVRGG